ncbi:MAG: UvrD-helicase domain-containing protein, partial [Oscillospiraceae bacterium]
MKWDWSDSQREAIERRGGSILVGAAAGSGKTAVLVERIVSLITDKNNPVDASRLLVVTFSRAAAAEMSARLSLRLAQMSADNPSDVRLKKQEIQIKRAQISTIHAFCSALLHEHFSELDIPPDFTVAEKSFTSLLRERALAETLAELYADKSGDIERVGDCFGRSRTDVKTEETISSLREFMTTLAFPEDWCAALSAESDESFCESKAGRLLLAYAGETIDAALSMLHEACDICLDCSELDGYIPSIEEDIESVIKIKALVGARAWDRCCFEVRSFKAKALKGARGVVDTDSQAAVQQLKTKAKELVQSLADKCFLRTLAQQGEDSVRQREVLLILVRAAKMFDEKYMQMKREKRIFDFSDLERCAIRLLCAEDRGPTKTAIHVSESFDYIFVDEYQDSNEVQELIFTLCSRGGKNLFFVGDVKQSIYGFRRADPGIFTARKDSSYKNETGLFPSYISLNENFRSAEPVINAVNDVFDAAMTREVGGTDYAGEDRLVASQNTKCCDAVGLEVRLLRADGKGDAAADTAMLVKKMLVEKYEVIQDGKPRPCEPRDFCVLLRAKTHTLSYTKAFAQNGIRASSGLSDDFFNNSEVSVALSLLRAIDNPRRDLELSAVMMSPLFSFNGDDMARLRLIDRKKPLISLVMVSKDNKCEVLRDILAELRRKSALVAPDELLETALERTDAEILLCAGLDMPQKRYNLHRLVAFAADFAATGGNLSRFLEICTYQAKKQSSLEGSPTQSKNSVSIMSIHKSKGLEWPIVIYAETQSLFNKRDAVTPPALFDQHLGGAIKEKRDTKDSAGAYMHKTSEYCALSIASLDREISEEIRVMYVAMTRAKQKIIITGTDDNPEVKLARLFRFSGKNGRLEPFFVRTAVSALNIVLLSLLSQYGCDIQKGLAECGEWSNGYIEVKIPKKQESEVLETPRPLPPAPEKEKKEIANIGYKDAFLVLFELNGKKYYRIVASSNKNRELAEKECDK